MEVRSSKLLDEALGLDQDEQSKNGGFILIEDCVEISGAFLLHHLIKHSLSPKANSKTFSSESVIVFIAFSQPFTHYDRILRKLGCNLVVQRENSKFIFINMLTSESTDGDEKITRDGRLFVLYQNLRKAMEIYSLPNKKNVTIMIDDVSLMEVSACDSSNDVLNFLHYCHTITSEFACQLVVLNHGDIYSCTNGSTFLLQIKYLADLLIIVEPLATGLATDVHGQLTILNKRLRDLQCSPRKMAHNFHFNVKENNIDCFYPGSKR